MRKPPVKLNGINTSRNVDHDVVIRLYHLSAKKRKKLTYGPMGTRMTPRRPRGMPVAD